MDLRFEVEVYEWIVKDKHAKPVIKKHFTPSQKDELLMFIVEHTDAKHQCCVDMVR